MQETEEEDKLSSFARDVDTMQADQTRRQNEQEKILVRADVLSIDASHFKFVPGDARQGLIFGDDEGEVECRGAWRSEWLSVDEQHQHSS